MAETTDWYRYTDETGAAWRIKTTGELAAIGGLLRVEFSDLRALPKRIEPRYVWFKESPRPADRLPARQKVIIESNRLKFILKHQRDWCIKGKNMTCISYYGEVAQPDGP
jgi:hypothetical protein